MIKVLIVDDHFIVRRGIRNILSSDKDILITGEASGSGEFSCLVENTESDIVILDITMPGKSGLDLLIEIKQKYPDLKVIILSMHNEEEIIIRAFKTGASAYLNKDSIPEDLIKTIKSVYRGENYIGASLTAMTALQNLKQERIQPHNLLSQREYQIFCLIASGNSNKEIADILSINAKTVSTLRTRLLDKMGLKTNSGIAAYALNNGITLNR